MNQESVLINTLPPPKVPLRILSQPAPAAVPPPTPPKGAVGPAAPAPPAAPAAPKAQKAAKERRMELQGLEGGDPRSTVHLIRLGVRNAVGTLPALLKKYGWVIPLTLFVWTVLGSFDAYKLMFSMPTLAPFWMAVNKVVLVLVFLTASYNSFIGKAVYATLVFKVGLPMVGRIRREGFGNVQKSFASLVPNLKSSWAQVGGKSMGLLVFFAGSGAFISNFLTRNNAVDKIAVSLAIALSLMKALSDGPRSIPFMTGRVVMKDLFVAMKKPSPVRNHHIYVAISGLVAGFLCSLPLAVLRKSMGENIGYILGTVAMAAGIGLIIALGSGKKHEKTA